MLIAIVVILFYYLLTIYLLFLWLEYSYDMNNLIAKYDDPVLKFTLSDEEMARVDKFHVVLPSRLSESYKPLRFKLMYELEKYT